MAKSWKTSVRASDLADDQRLEVLCLSCKAVRYLKRKDITDQQLYIDELERATRCVKRGCGGNVRIAMVRRDEMSGFVGGLA